jgi:adenine deaminase
MEVYKRSMKDKDSMFGTADDIKTLIDVALGKEKADLTIVNGNLVNVYTGELLPAYSVAIKGEKIAYVGKSADHTIGADTRVIDATGRVLIPGLIDAHTHLMIYTTIDQLLRYVIRTGTTTIITETIEMTFSLGEAGIWESLKATGNQPIKIFITVPSMATTSRAAYLGAIRPQTIRRMLKHPRVVGLGETPWQHVLQGNDRILGLFAETLSTGKKLEGHSAGAKNNKLIAYIAAGISSCHEAINYEEALERLRLGLSTQVRVGDTRNDLEDIAKIKDEKIDFRRLTLSTDVMKLKQLIERGYMDIIVQKAINLGINPITAIQMATINTAEHFRLDSLLGGIAPSKYADILIIPDLQTIQPELVISNGQVIAQNGQSLVTPRKHRYSKLARNSIRITRKMKPQDFRISVGDVSKEVEVRIINQVTELVTQEERVTMRPTGGLLEADVGQDILKVAVIDTVNEPVKMFVGLIKGTKMSSGAFATTTSWGLAGIVVVVGAAYRGRGAERDGNPEEADQTGSAISFCSPDASCSHH